MVTPPDALKLIKELRDKTNMPLLKCKEALINNQWDIDKAMEWLRKQNPRMGLDTERFWRQH